jgi:hypothetical protein
MQACQGYCPCHRGGRRPSTAKPGESAWQDLDVIPRLPADSADRLRVALRRTGYDAAGVSALLGDEAYHALGRGEPVPALRASAAGGELGVLVRLFLLGEVEPEPAVTAALRPLATAAAVASGILHADQGCLWAAVDIRPYGDWWVVSDLAGPWFEPVAGRRFDQVVSNPPFVVGPGRVEHVYRDSGLAGDDGSALVVRALPGHLTDGGTGQVLASWLHPRAGDWTDRVAAWLPTAGVDAWVVQRDVADPALYVGTWLADSGLDPRSPQGRTAAENWLDWFAHHKIDGVGFGFVTLRRTGALACTVVCEDLREPMDGPLGPEAAGWLGGAALLAGCTGALELGELISLLAGAYGEPADPMVAAVLPVIRELVRHGLLLPAELCSGE